MQQLETWRLTQRDGRRLEVNHSRPITKCYTVGKPTTGRRRIQMLHDSANDGGFVALKRAAEDRYGDRGCQKLAVQQKTIYL